MQVGVLAFQGSVEPHAAALAEIAPELPAPVAVRRPEQLETLTHLIIPGGESTTLHHLMELYGLWEPIRQRAEDGSLAIFGTCAGAILLGNRSGERPPRMGVFPLEVERNAYGRQRESFIAPVEVSAAVALEGPPRFEAVFIRAPRLKGVPEDATVLGLHGEDPVLVRWNRLLVATFHPELTPDRRVHEYFLGL